MTEGLRLLDDWDGAGQRLTASGATVLDNMVVYADEFRSHASRSVEDPYVQQAVGEISARAFVAEAGVLAAAASIDRALSPGAPTELSTEASIAVAEAQFCAAEASLRCAELVFDVGGASTTLREHNLDRHWRNARTVANHNPRAYKAAVVGAYRLNGTEPPGALF